MEITLETVWTMDIATTIIVLSIAGALDALYREVDPELWPPAIIIGFSLGLAFGLNKCSFEMFKLYIIIGLVLALAALLLYLAGLLGGADFYAIGFLALTLSCPPSNLGLPPILNILFIAELLGLFYKTYALARAYSRGYRQGKLGYLIVSARVFLEDPVFKWWVVRGGSIEEVEDLYIELAREPDRLVEISPGTPLVAMMFAAVVLYIVGLRPLDILLLHFLG